MSKLCSDHSREVVSELCSDHSMEAVSKLCSGHSRALVSKLCSDDCRAMVSEMRSEFLLSRSTLLFDRSKVVPVHAMKHTGEAEE